MATSVTKIKRTAPFFIISLLSLLFIYIIEAGDYLLSVVYAITALFSLKLIWDYSGKRPSLFFLFMVSYQLFIGGRFFVYLFSQEDPIFSLHGFFTDYDAIGNERIRVFSYVYLFLVFGTIGFCVGSSKDRKLKFVPKLQQNEKMKIDTVLCKLFPVFCVFALYHAYESLVYALSHGYETIALNANAEDNISYLAKFANMSIQVFAAASIAYGSKKTILKYLVLLLFSSIIIVICGSRGAFGSLVLFILWVYSRFEKVSIKKISLYGGIGMALLLILFSISFRAESYGMIGLSPMEAVKDFFWSNGGSLPIFAVSITIDNYPIYPYFQTLFVGSNFIFTHFFGVPLKPEQISFQGHLCNTLDSTAFYNGAGLGWTANGDLYLFSGGNIILYCILTYLVARLISYIDNSSYKASFYLFMAGALAFGLFMIPRGNFASLFAMIPYVYIYFFLIKYLTHFVGRTSISGTPYKKNVHQNTITNKS